MTKINISREEDRLTMASILVKNGYTVRQSRRKKKGNAYEYCIEFAENENEKTEEQR